MNRQEFKDSLDKEMDNYLKKVRGEEDDYKVVSIFMKMRETIRKHIEQCSETCGDIDEELVAALERDIINAKN